VESEGATLILISLLLIALAVLAVLRGAEVRLTLLLAAVALASLAGAPLVIVRSFLDTFASEKFLVPIGCCMGFAFVLRHTECDKHLVHLLTEPLKRVRVLLIPGVVLVGVLVNVPIISQSSAAVAVGSVLVPVLRAARFSAITIGAALALGCSIGGELLNPGAPELGSVVKARQEDDPNVSPIDVVQRVIPLLLVSVAVAVPLFWLSCRGDQEPAPEDKPTEGFRLNLIKALVPLLPLVLLFLTALPPPFQAIHVPPTWLMTDNALKGSFGSRLVGAAMLIGTVAAALTSPSKAKDTGKVFFEGAGYALTNITSLIIAANCFGAAVEKVGLGDVLGEVIKAAPGLLWPLAALMPLGFGWVCGSGMAAAESLYRFFDDPAQTAGADPLRVGALVSLAAAAGRTLSPVSAVVLMASSLSGATPLGVVRRMALPLLAGLAAATAVAWLMG
jgi:DcuC family C4-dicarboxylate transporter